MMNTTSKKECYDYMKSIKCKSCKKSLEMDYNQAKKQKKAQLKNKMSNMTERKLIKQLNKCKI